MSTDSEEPVEGKQDKKYLAALTLSAIGVVIGDIGTSPLYAIRECFSGVHGLEVTVDNVLGVLSLIIWSLIIVVSIKYITYVMKADNRGEGGVLALMALVFRNKLSMFATKGNTLVFMGLFGAALLYGDGVITPAISVLSAVEGLEIVTPFFKPYINFLTIIILTGIFFFQKKGTHKIGAIFGPVITLWLVTIGVLGLIEVFKTPSVLLSFNPYYGVKLLLTSGSLGFFVLGAVFLSVTGSEALYADMGHFGKRPIRLGWFYIALPGLLLNYLGQGALLIANPVHAVNPFYHLAPSWFLIPLVVLATCATIIASQALISGAFSLTKQAVQLGYLPRLQIRHTSSREIGQIYIANINLFLWFFTVLLVVIFQSSSNLAAAYGIAVSTTMVITTILTYFVSVSVWKWERKWALAVFWIFIIIDITFLASNMLKFFSGGWFPIVVALGIFTFMTTWYRGRQILNDKVQELTKPLSEFLKDLRSDNSLRIPGTAVFMTRNVDKTPPALLHNLKHNKVLHKTVILLGVKTEEVPFVPVSERITLTELPDGFYQILLSYGFMELPNVPRELAKLEKQLSFDLDDVTYFFGRESLLEAEDGELPPWKQKLFTFMTRNAEKATLYYMIPPENVVEIGFQISM